ncbi:hypothetical protein [Paracoccus spongiarum]|uniref:MotA/TolQ/ExbB proton channel domain-containing protein n=1 Tax=Paracoccus spongiarum TaxID=3064387 RepID=A0ABT9JGU0_9RHOB|nr:hypothetical protein [Paracoccus sp. 2205BS29-5]MDP5309028.1 hypothetical protein [Paracoccus sp. 2205BS29-5]
MSAASDLPNAVPVQNGHRYSRQAGLVVCIMSACFVGGIILLLFLQAWLQHQELGRIATPTAAAPVTDPFYLLDQEALRLRASRASISQLYRHFMGISGLIVSMMMVLLGAILIFDRVQSAEANKLIAALSGKGNVEATSSFPGMLLCVMGAATVALNLYFSGPQAAPFVTRDIPAYLQDVNWSRNQLGLYPCFGINTDQAPEPSETCKLTSATGRTASGVSAPVNISSEPE